MPSLGTGLPTVPTPDRVLAQPGDVAPLSKPINAEAYSNAQSWAQIAQAGSRLADSAGDYAKVEIHQAKVGYLAEQDVEIARTRADMRDKFAKDPSGFDANWTAYRDGKIGAAEPWAVPHLTKSLGSEGNSAYSAILSERRAADNRLDTSRIESLASLTGNDVIGSAMAGTLGDPDGQIKIGKYRAVLDSAVTAGLIPKEKADLMFDDTMSKAQGEIAARDGVDVYRAKGFDAAVDHLKKGILENESLSLKGESRYKAFNRGLSAVRLAAAQDKEDRAGFVEVSKDLRARIASNQPYDDGEVRDTLALLQRTGAAAEFKKLSVDHAVAVATAPYRSGLDLKTFASAVATQRVAAIPAGLTEPGNIDLNSRPVVKNADGSISTVRSLSFNENGKEILIPTVAADGSGILSDQQAIEQYRRTGQHLGKFDTPANATAYAISLHKDQERQYSDQGLPFAGAIAKRVQAQFVEQSRKAWPEFKAKIEQGKVLDQEDFTAVRYAAALSGDANWQKQVEELAVANGIGGQARALPANEQQAVVDNARADIGVAVAESLQKQFARQAKMVKDDPVGFAVERFHAQPAALDFSSPQATAVGVGERVTIARGVSVEQGTPPGNPFRPAETSALAGAIGTGEPKAAAAALDALAGLPDDFLTPALGNAEIKTAVAGAARSSDPARYSTAMQFMDRLWSRSPETTKALFGEDQIHALMTWQTNLRYMSPDQLAKERERAAIDPQVRERMKKNEAEGRELANKYSFNDVAKQFDTSWWITPGPLARATGAQPLPPVDALTRDAMMGDWVNLYARRYAETLDKDKAAEQATALMKTKWTASPTNGGRLMLNAPETIRDRSGNAIYPAVNGSHDWMTAQLQAGIDREMKADRTPLAPGADSFDEFGNLRDTTASTARTPYTLVSDRRTQSEAQAGQPATYTVVVHDPATDRDVVLPRRFQFDPSEVQAKARTDFETQRTRVLDDRKALEEYGIGGGLGGVAGQQTEGGGGTGFIENVGARALEATRAVGNSVAGAAANLSESASQKTKQSAPAQATEPTKAAPTKQSDGAQSVDEAGFSQPNNGAASFDEAGFSDLAAKGKVADVAAAQGAASFDEAGFIGKVQISPQGRFAVEGLPIKDAIKPGATYGKDATANAQPFSAIIVHHTGTDKLSSALNTLKGDPFRGGDSFGYHFYIDLDGSITQAAPLEARTNHVQPPGSANRTGRDDISNSNAVGISFVGKSNNPTTAQLESGTKLAEALMKSLDIPIDNIVGHGEVQNNRVKDEGMALVNRIRSVRAKIASR